MAGEWRFMTTIPKKQQEMPSRSRTPAPKFLITGAPTSYSWRAGDRDTYPLYASSKPALTEPLFDNPDFWRDCDPAAFDVLYKEAESPIAPKKRTPAALLFGLEKEDPEPKKGWRRFICCFERDC